MLLQNQTLHAQYPYKRMGASTVATESGNLRSQLGIRGRCQIARFVSDWDKWQSIPQGYGMDAIFQPLKGGGMGASASASGIAGGSSMSGAMSMGRNCSATLSGSGDIAPPSLSLLVQLACTILGQGDLSADMVGTVQMAATLAGQGDIDGALGMISWMTANLTGSGTVSPSSSMFGTANMSANIYVNTGTASAKELAAEVWEALAADFNNAGTMGQKLNGAGSAGDPWTTALPGPYAAGTAGKIVGDKLLTWQKFLALK